MLSLFYNNYQRGAKPTSCSMSSYYSSYSPSLATKMYQLGIMRISDIQAHQVTLKVDVSQKQYIYANMVALGALSVHPHWRP